MSSSTLFLLLILLACPLMMIFMMRGMHGGGHGSAGHGHSQGGDRATSSEEDCKIPVSLDDLRRQSDSLDREIDEREAREQSGSAA